MKEAYSEPETTQRDWSSWHSVADVMSAQGVSTGPHMPGPAAQSMHVVIVWLYMQSGLLWQVIPE